MKLAWWMIGGCIASWLAVAAVIEPRTGIEVLLGMLGPLAMASGTWVLVERTYRQNPLRVTPVMVTAFAGKMVFFAAYVALMLTVLPLRPVPFVASFTVYFVALYLVEALGLRRLFTAARR